MDFYAHVCESQLCVYVCTGYHQYGECRSELSVTAALEEILYRIYECICVEKKKKKT